MDKSSFISAVHPADYYEISSDTYRTVLYASLSFSSHSVCALKSSSRLHVTRRNRPPHQLQQLSDCVCRLSSAIIGYFATSSNDRQRWSVVRRYNTRTRAITRHW